MSQLVYNAPSNGDWNRALPIGNGKLGAMIYGEVTEEHMQLNEDTIWFGGKRNRNNSDAKKYLNQVQKLILEGKIAEAEELSKYALTGTPQSQHSYQTLGDVYFDYCRSLGQGTGYKRVLDLDTAIHHVMVSDEKSGIEFRRETFASLDYNCIAAHFSSSQTGAMDLAASLQRLSFYEHTEHTNNSLYITGNLGGGGMDFCCGMRFVSDGKTLEGIGEHLVTKGATNVYVYITAVTQYRSENPREEVEKILDHAAACSYIKMKEIHILEYKKYFDTMRLQLDYDKKLDQLTTEERLSRISENTPDNGLLNTYMDFGRYLLISSSRGDSLPANLQGIWNRDVEAPWGSKYTININTEMNYWPANLCNLSACQMPLFAHLLRMKENGRKTAREMYGCKGFVAHHNTDIWADTAPQDIYIPATFWVMGGAWLCTHIWNQYLYTRDIDFLKEMYPVLKESVHFFMDFLIEKDGKLVTCPSVSPENTYIMEDGTRGCLTYGSTMDNEILHELFDHFVKAANEVGEQDTDFIKRTERIERQIPDIQIGKYGQIMEWQKDYEEAEPGHRHISHLWALHPAHQITPDQTPERCEAARVTLQRRLANGGGHTGWSRAWIINMYARLWDAKHAYTHLIQLLKKSTLSNLFDNHPPFQIDGNFGAIASMGELLLQSDEKRTILLPALPAEWSTGTVDGLLGVGGIRYNLAWENGRLTEAIMISDFSQEVTVVYREKVRQVFLQAKREYRF